MVPQIQSDEHALWIDFFEPLNLSSDQQEQFKRYYDLLLRANDIHNLTAITDLKAVLADHFQDSLALRAVFDCSKLRMLADIGTGGGFPGIPLKIAFPELPLVLIEVTHKKVLFLEEVCKELGLQDVIFEELDWRTFLRQTDYPIDLFTARASLQPEELVRVFMPSSPYKQAQLVYWASKQWAPSLKVKPYIERTEQYTVGAKQRKLIFFSSTGPNL